MSKVIIIESEIDWDSPIIWLQDGTSFQCQLISKFAYNDHLVAESRKPAHSYMIYIKGGAATLEGETARRDVVRYVDSLGKQGNKQYIYNLFEGVNPPLSDEDKVENLGLL